MDCIYICKETGVSPVNAPPLIIASRWEKQIGQVTSAECFEQVAVHCKCYWK